MNRARERLSELKDKGLITRGQYDELLAALGTVENQVSQVPEAPRLPVEPAVATAPLPPVTPSSAPQAVGRRLSVRLISEDLHVRGVQGLPAVRFVRGQSAVRTRQNGDVVEVESGLTAGEFHGFSFSFGFGSNGDPVELEVPANMPCELKTVSGDITLSNLKGEVVVRSVSGNVDASTLAHLTSAQSTSGNVDVDECLVDGDIVSKSGDVDIRNSTVRGMIKSYSGDVSVLNAVLNDADVLSFSGDVSLEGVTVQSGARLKTTSGDVRAELDQHDVMVDVETRSGEASVRGPGVDVEVQRQRIPVGLATVELSVHTGTGDIEVRLT